ncbi:DUF6029 family protein [Flavobacterium sp.]|uniref:DUF6029 family protein n=1 Tax=Flavobacterium sp. TaxID=239 RepID=UPI00262FCBCB|nr:DUF6029 family protein [Flavobacterium sp.]
MIKNYFYSACLALLVTAVSFAQTEEKPKDKGTLSGGIESNTQWYLNDKGLKDEVGNSTVQPIEPLRSNTYLFLNYTYKKWIAGIQGEAYEQNALLNMNPKYNGTNVATYFVQYKGEKLDATAGYFYEQFGSGLLFRSWEDRALGINNALRGGRIIFKPNTSFTAKLIYGKQRTGFDVARSEIFGGDWELRLSNVLKWETTELTLGGNYVGRYEKTDIVNPNFDALTSGISGRINLTHNSVYFSAEYNYKTEDAVVQAPGQVDNKLIKPGSALLINLGYSKKGFGIDGTFRRLENMSFFSERAAKGNVFNDRIMNFIPSLTKQHHYNLANIYVYQAQPNVLLAGSSYVKAGDIGGQIDLFYDIKKGTLLGGKYGTKIALNFSNYNALSGTYYIFNPQNYATDFFGFGQRMFSDLNFEITKKWNTKWQTILSYINQYYNKKYIEDAAGEIKTHIVGADIIYKLKKGQSIRFMGEHMWADYDRKNWASATLEFNFNSKFSMYVYDLYNYGNDLDYYRNHYYNVGGSFRKNASRISLNYGRQRGGLVCVGGVCRFVPESSGLTLTFNTSF